jgi:hypothetical protein
MRKVVYRDRLTLIIGMVNRAKALQVVQVVNSLMDAEIDNAGFISNEFNYAYVSNAPLKVLWDGKLLEDGTHTLSFEEYDELTLTLPITRDCFDALPVDLTAHWIEAATLENEWLNAHFLDVMRTTMPSLFALPSVEVPS